MDPSYLVTGVGCWSGGVRVRRRHLRSGREPAPAKRSGRVSSRRDPFDDQVSLVVDFFIPLSRIGAGAYVVGVVGHPYLAILLPLWLTMPVVPFHHARRPCGSVGNSSGGIENGTSEIEENPVRMETDTEVCIS
ncbi:hypothetical protein BHE74_00009076 [Ensete ventricosum]|nr:hypothetical protein BHE74_00009076 [Ensete ventricosum]